MEELGIKKVVVINKNEYLMDLLALVMVRGGVVEGSVEVKYVEGGVLYSELGLLVGLG